MKNHYCEIHGEVELYLVNWTLTCKKCFPPIHEVVKEQQKLINNMRNLMVDNLSLRCEKPFILHDKTTRN